MSRSAPLHLPTDPAFALLKEHVIGLTGLAYYQDKDADLARRLTGRLSRRGLADWSSYLALLHDPGAGPGEVDELVKELTIGETFFFRHTELFEALRTVVLPDLIERNRPHRRLRIWSAGCSTGAEPYSLSILLRRDLAHLVAGWDIAIIGTDVNHDFLARARAGQFEDWALRATPDELRRDCFQRTGPPDRPWVLDSAFRAGVSFRYHNLVAHPIPSHLHDLFALDLILCRNVMIYFNDAIDRRLVGGFYDSLVEGGWLLVGHAEPRVPLFRAFRTVSTRGAILYQKAGPVAAAVPWAPPPLPALQPLLAPAAPAPRLAPPPDRAAVRALADRGEWDEALRGCERLLRADRLDPALHFCHALVLEQMGRHGEAEGALRRALYLDRRFVLAHYYLGLFLQKAGLTAEASRSFRNAAGLLDRLDPAYPFPDGDGLTAGELAKMTHLHLALLEGT